jgi:hypothetical protein
MTPQSHDLLEFFSWCFQRWGVSLLSLLISDPAYAANPLRQNLWRAGHARAGVLLR